MFTWKLFFISFDFTITYSIKINNTLSYTNLCLTGINTVIDTIKLKSLCILPISSLIFKN